MSGEALALWKNLGCNNLAAEVRTVNLIYHPCGCMMRCSRFYCLAFARILTKLLELPDVHPVAVDTFRAMYVPCRCLKL